MRISMNRRELKNLAIGIARFCVGRNNDIGGYWAVGVLYRQALAEEMGSIILDVLADEKLEAPPLERYRQDMRKRFVGLGCGAAKISTARRLMLKLRVMRVALSGGFARTDDSKIVSDSCRTPASC